MHALPQGWLPAGVHAHAIPQTTPVSISLHLPLTCGRLAGQLFRFRTALMLSSRITRTHHLARVSSHASPRRSSAHRTRPLFASGPRSPVSSAVYRGPSAAWRPRTRSFSRRSTRRRSQWPNGWMRTHRIRRPASESSSAASKVGEWIICRQRGS